MGGSVKRWRAALAASILAVATALVAGSCWNPLNWTLQTWADLSLVKVQGGGLWLGSDDLDYPEENSSHYVTVSTFLMSRYEVTQQLYYAVMYTNPSTFQSADEPRRPVECVTWLEAVEFCNELSVYAGFVPCYTIDEMAGVVTCNFLADGYRLPTEAEWEFAASGGRAASIQYLYSGSDDIDVVAWYQGNSSATTHPVGSWASNDLDLYDMTGNVWEWCWDTWRTDYYTTNPYGWDDPLGPMLTEAYYNDVGFDNFSVRGGCYVNDTTPGSDWLRVSCRTGQLWSGRYDGIGFRVVRRP